MTPYYTVMHDFGIMHDKSWGIGLVLFAMTKSCHFSQSTCRSLRLMYFQEKQEQGYTCSIHNIFTRSKVKGVKCSNSSKSFVSILMKFLNPFGFSDDSSLINEWWAPYRARLQIQYRAHTLGCLLFRLILRIALAIIIIHKVIAILSSSIFFPQV